MSQNMVSLKLLPRIDYSRPRGALRTAASESEREKNKNKKKRPMAKLFDPEKVSILNTSTYVLPTHFVG